MTGFYLYGEHVLRLQKDSCALIPNAWNCSMLISHVLTLKPTSMRLCISPHNNIRALSRIRTDIHLRHASEACVSFRLHHKSKLVRMKGLEPPRPKARVSKTRMCYHFITSANELSGISRQLVSCRWESNPQTLRHAPLKRTCLPVPPRQVVIGYIADIQCL
jgi:hypothetical protein